MPSSPDHTHCPECRAPLEADGVCLACVFGGALAVEGEAEGEPSEAESRFGSFAPQVAGQFGKYLLRRTLGSGGMGVIWEAEEPALRRLVALKMIRGFAFATEAEKARFQTEAAAAAQLDHAHIVPVYEVGETEGQPYFTMKLLEGGSLSQRLKAGALEAKEAASLMEKLARAVQHAHERGVLHRDLKPGNVLFDKAGEPFLTDFGLAKLVDAEQGLTLSHAQVGTPQYMSPEQARGRARDVTTASDVWALGAMLYQMVTGRLPFPGQTPAEIFSHIAHDDPVSLRTLAASADNDLETLCLRCLEKDPARRLPSAGELADELARWLRGEPILSRRVTARERALRWMRRHPWRVAAAAALVVSLLAGTIVSLVLWRSAEENSARATQSAASERMTSYVSTMSAALAARERHDFARARQLLAAAPEEHRGFEWRLLSRFCEGDQRSLFRLPEGDIPEALSPGPNGEGMAIVTRGGVLHLCRPDGTPLRPARPLPPVSGEADAGKLTPRDYHSLHYAPGGQYFALSLRNTVRVFDAETLEVLMEQGGVILPQSAWLDDRRLLFGYDSSNSYSPGTGAWICDVPSRSTAALPQPWAGPLAVSADLSTVALTDISSRSRVGLFRAAAFSEATLQQGAQPVHYWQAPSHSRCNMLALSPEGNYIAALCGSLEAPARMLVVAEPAGEVTWLEQGFRDSMTGLAFHPADPSLAVTGTDATVRMFRFLEPIPETGHTYDDGRTPAIREHTDANGPHSPPVHLLTRSAQQGRTLFLLGHEGRGTGCFFAADGTSLFTSAADGTVRCWNSGIAFAGMRIDDASYMLQVAGHPSASPDGSRILYSASQGRVRYWKKDHVPIPVADSHMPLAVLPEGRFATMERRSSDIVIWQEAENTVREEGRIPGPGYIQGFSGLLRGVVFPGGDKIAGILPGRIFVADLQSLTVTATDDQGWDTGPSRAWGIALSPDGRHIAATGLGRRVRLYDPADLTKPAPPLGEFRTSDTALTFHPNGSRLYCGNEDGRIRVFDTKTWTELPGDSWPAHRSAVTAISVSNDARLIATAGDTTLKLWRAENASETTPLELLSFPTYHPAAWIQFGRAPQGTDWSLLHVAPGCPLEIWVGDRTAAHSPQRFDPEPANAGDALPTEALDALLQQGITYRLRALDSPGAPPRFIGFLMKRENSLGRTTLSLVTEDQPDAVILECSRLAGGSNNGFALKAENYPKSSRVDPECTTPILQGDDSGWMEAAWREPGREGRGHFLLVPPRARNTGSAQAVSLRSQWSHRLGFYLRHQNGAVRLSPAKNDDAAFKEEATWVLEPK